MCDTVPLIFTCSLWLGSGNHLHLPQIKLICVKVAVNWGDGNMRLALNLCGRKSILGERWRGPNLFLNDYLLNNCALFTKRNCTVIGQLCILEEWAPNTPEPFRGVPSSGISSDVAWSFYKKCSNIWHLVHIAFKGVSLEAFSRKLMFWHYCQIAEWLSSANSKFPKKSVL
jgi:hypothetical protein